MPLNVQTLTELAQLREKVLSDIRDYETQIEVKKEWVSLIDSLISRESQPDKRLPLKEVLAQIGVARNAFFHNREREGYPIGHGVGRGKYYLQSEVDEYLRKRATDARV